MNSALQSLVDEQFAASLAVKQALVADDDLRGQVAAVAALCVDRYQAGNKMMLAGNGGSAADAQHIAAEFVARFYRDRKAMPALALTTDTSILTAVSNDYGYEALFRRQLEAQGKPGDLFVGISTSGNSPNVIAALRACPALGITSIGLTGRDGGAMNGLCDHLIKVPSDDTPRIQESHILIGHTLCLAVENSVSSG